MQFNFNSQQQPRDPFVVPEGYFDTFASRLMAQLPEAEAPASVAPVRMTLLQRLKPWLSAAAVIAVVAVCTQALRHRVPQLTQHNYTHTAQASSADVEADNLSNFYLFDNQAIYDYTTEQ